MNGEWNKCKSLLAAVAVIIFLEGVIMVWKEMESTPMLPGSIISTNLENSTNKGIDATSSSAVVAYDVSKTATSPVDDTDTSSDNYHGVNNNNNTYTATSKLASQQIQNYKDGKGIILNIHITHHAGTFICNRIGRAPGTRGTPSFACMGVKPEDNVTIEDNYPREQPPWTYKDTAKNIELVRPFFHMISWEFGNPNIPLKNTEWENPNLVSLIVMREPISRLLAGDGDVNRQYPGMMMSDGAAAKNDGGMMKENQWWQYATKDKKTNNYALSKLANGCCQRNHTDPKHLEAAKELLSRFTFVLDIRCLDKGMKAMANILGIKQLDAHQKRVKNNNKLPHGSNSDRIGYKEVYDYLVDSNKLDIQLYEWSKSISLVRCDDDNDS
jgi:hypothetical protein